MPSACSPAVTDYGKGQDAVFDFLSEGEPKHLSRCDLFATNPPFGKGGRTAVAFIEAGLLRLATADTMHIGLRNLAYRADN